MNPIEHFGVLIIDRERLIGRLLGKIIAKVYPMANVTTLNDIDIAIEELNHQQFDLIISDLFVPQPEEGYRLAKFVKENHPTTRFHLISGSNDEQYAHKLNELGVTLHNKMNYIEKLSQTAI